MLSCAKFGTIGAAGNPPVEFAARDAMNRWGSFSDALCPEERP